MIALLESSIYYILNYKNSSFTTSNLHLKTTMHLSSILLLGLGAGALSKPIIDDTSSSLEKRTGHTGWIASYAADDDNCSKGYISGADRPELQWDHATGSIMPVNFTLASGTDNVGIYFGSGTNAFDNVGFFSGEWFDHGLKMFESTGKNDGYPGACISAKAFGYPWTAVSVVFHT